MEGISFNPIVNTNPNKPFDYAAGKTRIYADRLKGADSPIIHLLTAISNPRCLAHNL